MGVLTIPEGTTMTTPTPTPELTPHQAVLRLTPEKRSFLAACIRHAGPLNYAHELGWLCCIDVFAVADAVGVHRKKAERMLEKFVGLGLFEARNNYDGWLLPLGLLAGTLAASEPELTQFNGEPQ